MLRSVLLQEITVVTGQETTRKPEPESSWLTTSRRSVTMLRAKIKLSDPWPPFMDIASFCHLFITKVRWVASNNNGTLKVPSEKAPIQ